MATVIPLFKVFMPHEVADPVLDTLYSGNLTQGPRVDEFETNLKSYLGTENVLTVNSGTTALSLALQLAGVRYGDEVISTPMTCIATNTPIVAAGARIVWADVNPNTGLIDPEDVARKITKRTVAIMAVDWGGMPCDYDALMTNGIQVISDAAHAFGSTYKGNKAGNLAHFTAFSFQAIKTITTGDGGVLTCAFENEYKRGKKLRWFGVDRDEPAEFRGKLDVPEAGFKYHMNDLNATIGIESLRKVHIPLSRQRTNAMVYNNRLPDFYEIPVAKYEYDSSSWLMTVLLPDRALRDAFVDFMHAQGVQVSRVHWRNDRHSAFSDFADDNLSGVDSFSDRMVCIPNHYDLDKTDRAYIISKMGQFAGIRI